MRTLDLQRTPELGILLDYSLIKKIKKAVQPDNGRRKESCVHHASVLPMGWIKNINRNRISPSRRLPYHWHGPVSYCTSGASWSTHAGPIKSRFSIHSTTVQCQWASDSWQYRNPRLAFYVLSPHFSPIASRLFCLFFFSLSLRVVTGSFDWRSMVRQF